MTKQSGTEHSGSHAYGSNVNTTHKGFRVLFIMIMVIVTVIIAVWLLVYATRNVGVNDGVVANIKSDVAIVNITSEGFSPRSISVAAGQQVKFVNTDTAPHRIVADSEYLTDFDSERSLTTGDSYTYVFDTPGTYSYYDNQSPASLTGTVEVRR